MKSWTLNGFGEDPSDPKMSRDFEREVTFGARYETEVHFCIRAVIQKLIIPKIG